MGVQQLLLSYGAKDKTYLDDVFSTFLYKGTNGANTVNTGLDMSGEGGLLWVKSRSNRSHQFFDTVRGVNKHIHSDTNAVEVTDSNMNQTFTSTGFTFNNTYTDLNDINGNYTSWSFRRSPGFFDIVSWSGDSATSRTISHNLGCIPGMIIIKKTDGTTSDWVVYHRSVGNTKALYLNATNYAYTGTYWFNDTSPTADEFTIGNIHLVNGSGNTYVAYLFAGGESTAATAKSVDFDGSNDYLSIADHADFDVGTNWTAECWFKADSLNGNWDAIFGQWTGGYVLEYVGTDLRFYLSDGSHKSLGAAALGTWHHVAISKSGSTTKIFLNGTQVVADFDMGTTSSSSAFTIGGNVGGAGYFNGKISNVRIVQGTAVYTSSFRPTTKPLTNITNTKLLCCNDSSQTGSTVTPGTITNNGSTASTDSPFDDPEGFKFGEGGDQNIIKCDSYIGNGSATGPEINLGWEPQWVMIKNASSSEDWVQLDNMRGLISDGNDPSLRLNTNSAEGQASRNWMNLTPTGFKLKSNPTHTNKNGDDYIYMAIRRIDGYVGKPIELGTDVFAMDTGNSSTTIPAYDSGFPVDFALRKNTTTAADWCAPARLTSGTFVKPNSDASQLTDSDFIFDSNTGWAEGSGQNSNLQSWMWKRYAGFDVLNYNITSASGQIPIPHSLGKAPEMIWQKHRTTDDSWIVYHKDLTANHWVLLDGYNAETDGGTGYWGTSSPTSSHFEIKGSSRYTGNHLFMLFASVDGISKVGSYSGSSSAISINCGFQPRFILIKRATGTNSWGVWDTVRGITDTTDHTLWMNSNGAQTTNAQHVNLISNGFEIQANNGQNNATNTGSSSDNYIYYVHA